MGQWLLLHRAAAPLVPARGPCCPAASQGCAAAPHPHPGIMENVGSYQGALQGQVES